MYASILCIGLRYDLAYLLVTQKRWLSGYGVRNVSENKQQIVEQKYKGSLGVHDGIQGLQLGSTSSKTIAMIILSFTSEMEKGTPVGCYQRLGWLFVCQARGFATIVKLKWGLKVFTRKRPVSGINTE